MLASRHTISLSDLSTPLKRQPILQGNFGMTLVCTTSSHPTQVETLKPSLYAYFSISATPSTNKISPYRAVTLCCPFHWSYYWTLFLSLKAVSCSLASQPKKQKTEWEQAHTSDLWSLIPSANLELPTPWCSLVPVWSWEPNFVAAPGVWWFEAPARL